MRPWLFAGLIFPFSHAPGGKPRRTAGQTPARRRRSDRCNTAPQERLEDDGEPFEEKMTRLTGELSEMFKQSHVLENEIKKNLKAIGYEIK